MFAFIVFIYVIGYILSYYYFKLLAIKVMKTNWTWEEAKFGLKMSLASYLAIPFVTFIVILAALEEKNDNTKPPWWL